MAEINQKDCEVSQMLKFFWRVEGLEEMILLFQRIFQIKSFLNAFVLHAVL